MIQTTIAVTAEPVGETPQQLRRAVYVSISVLILMTGILLRFYHLGNRSLWYDEAVTANISRGGFEEMVARTRTVSAPVVHPLFLYVTERLGSNAWMVRFPSALASFAAVLMMLAMPKVGVNAWAALFAAAIMSFAASQVRYAQEVREYSLAVFVATFLMFCLFQWESGGASRQPVLLYVALFLAPLVQYGLVLLAAAVLITMLLRALVDRAFRTSIAHIALGTSCFVAGGILSYLLTLRSQVGGKGLGAQWYLATNYFNSRSEGAFHFVVSNTKQLLSFFIPGQLLVPVIIVTGIVVVALQARRGKIATITLLLCAAFITTILASFRHIYPYGGIRQCLFLAPVLMLFAGSVFADLLQFVKAPYRLALAAVLFGLIAVSSARGISRQWPYREIEDTQSLLRELANAAPGDQVWVNHDAVDAFKFYLPAGDARFTYGKYHANPNEYMPELLGSISPGTNRLWFAFSHLEQASDSQEEQLILKTLPSEWKLEKRVSATNAELYLAKRQ